jgi:outer membrane immunogenic protein
VVAPAPALFIPGDSFEVRSDWQASLRGRIGYAWDRWMIYGTGGVAFTRVIANANWIAVGIFPATFASESKTLIGPTAGLGVEYAFANNWSLALEGRYSWYGSTTFNAGLLATSAIGAAAPVFTFAPTSQTVRVETFELTARLNWKF